MIGGVCGLDDKWLSAVELSEQTNIPVSTVRRYLATFKQFFKGDDRVRGRNYHPDSIAVIVRIKSLYDGGDQTHEISDTLSREFAMTLTVEDDEVIPPASPPYATKEDIDELHEVIADLLTEIKASRHENHQLKLISQDQSDKDAEIERLQKELDRYKNKKWWMFWKRS